MHHLEPLNSTTKVFQNRVVGIYMMTLLTIKQWSLPGYCGPFVFDVWFIVLKAWADESIAKIMHIAKT